MVSGDHPSCALQESEGLDPLSYRAFGAFKRVLHLQRQLMTKLTSGHDSFPGQAHCLRMLAGRDGASQRELADGLHLSAPAVTTMLQRMQKAGLVDRRPDATDQRVTRVYLTPAGQEREAEVRAAFGAFVSAAFDSMSVHDREELVRLLEQTAQNTEEALAEC
jgi:MarR family transcriptional regulator, organic hydroperoxide resistance regulator